MVVVTRHQHQSNVGKLGGLYHRLSAVPGVLQTCKGSGIKHVVHMMPVGLQQSHAVVTWAVAPTRSMVAPAVPVAFPATSVMASGEGGAAFGRCADAGNTWQEDQDMPDAVNMHNPLVVAVPHPTPAGALAGTHAGLAPAHLVLRASGGRATLSLPSQVLWHCIMWHEEHNATQNILMQQLSGGKDKYASVRLVGKTKAVGKTNMLLCAAIPVH